MLDCRIYVGLTPDWHGLTPFWVVWGSFGGVVGPYRGQGRVNRPGRGRCLPLAGANRPIDSQSPPCRCNGEKSPFVLSPFLPNDMPRIVSEIRF